MLASGRDNPLGFTKNPFVNVSSPLLWCETGTRVDLSFIGCTWPGTWWVSLENASKRQNFWILVRRGVGGGGLPGPKLSPNQDGKCVHIVEDFGAYENQGVREGLLQEERAADALGHRCADGLRARISPQDVQPVHAGKTNKAQVFYSVLQ